MKQEVFKELVVVKRSGQRVDFDGTKIAIAIKHAFDSIEKTYNEKDINIVYEKVLKYIEENYEGRKTINVEDIQDIIENKLKQTSYIDVYESFQSYRDKRAASRKAFSIKQQHKFVKAIEKLVSDVGKDDIESPRGTLIKYGKTISNEFSKAYLLDNKYVRAHEEGIIYIHNLDYYTLGIPSSCHLDLSNMDITDNYLNDIKEMLLKSKQEVSGEITLSAIDYLLSPWLIKEYKKNFKQILFKYLKLCGFIEYINIRKLEDTINSIRTININYDHFDLFILNDKVKNIYTESHNDTLILISTKLTNYFNDLLKSLEENDIYNNKYSVSFGTNDTYEGNYINKIYLNVLNDNNKFNNVTTIFKIKENINIKKTDKNYYLLETISNLILEGKNIGIANVSAKINRNGSKEIEYFSNGERIYENILSINCLSIGRMTLAKTSLNMARLGLKNKSNLVNFYNELEQKLELIKNELILTFELESTKNKENYKYLFNNNILDDEKLEANQKVRKVIKNGTLSINLVGLKECVTLLGKENNYIVDILKFIKNKIETYSIENKLNFVICELDNLETRKNLKNIDASIYGIVDKVTDKYSYESLNNSFDKKIDLTDKLKQESIYQTYLNGGYTTLIKIDKKTTQKKIMEIINILFEVDIGYAKIGSDLNVN